MSDNLFLNKQTNKEIQINQYEELTMTTGMKKNFLPEDDGASNTGSAPYVPVPKEARKKSVSGSVGSLFHRKKKSGIGAGNNPSSGGNAVAEGEEHQVELEHVHTEATTNRRINDETLHSFLEKDLANKELLETLTDETKTRLIGLQKLTAILTGKNDHEYSSEEVKSLNDAVTFFVEYNNDVKAITANKKVDENYAAFFKKYQDKYGFTEKDHEILGTYSVMYKDAHGGMSVDEKKERRRHNFIDTTTNEDLFKQSYVVKLKEEANYKGHVYTHSFINMHEYKEPLFKHEPTAKDVKQGNVGDCYLISAINAIVEKRPEAIKEMMQDNGPTVTVRFFRPDGRPLYVKVKKTLPCQAFKAKDGDIMDSELQGAGKGGSALWVCYIEKAFAAVREELEDIEKAAKIREANQKEGTVYAGLDYGTTNSAMKALLGPKAGKRKSHMKVKSYSQGFFSSFFSKSIEGKDLAKAMRADQKAELSKALKKEGKKLDKVQWNIKKAEMFFGVKIQDKDDKLYAFFRNDNLFKSMENHISMVLREYFTTSTLRTENDALFLTDYLKQTVKKLPKFNIPGYDEEQMKLHYINYLRKYITSCGRLTSTVNKTGEYTQKEDKAFAKLLKAKENDQLITASTGKIEFSLKKAEGVSAGEKIVYAVAGEHGYSIRDITEEEREVAGKKVKLRFVTVVNPWKDYIRQYDKDGNPYLMKNENVNGKKVDVGGAFKMELRDFLNTFDKVSGY